MLLPIESFTPKEIQLVVDIFLYPFEYPVHKQNWSADDVKYFLQSKINFWGIIKSSNNKLIGYVSISDKFCFELVIVNEYRNFGYSIDATLMAISYVFEHNPDISEIFTHIFKKNVLSLRSAESFGWNYKTKVNDWLTYTLMREKFYDSEKLLTIRSWLGLSFSVSEE